MVFEAQLEGVQHFSGYPQGVNAGFREENSALAANHSPAVLLALMHVDAMPGTGVS
jgi:hypothetical protein